MYCNKFDWFPHNGAEETGRGQFQRQTRRLIEAQIEAQIEWSTDRLKHGLKHINQVRPLRSFHDDDIIMLRMVTTKYYL